MKQQTVDETQVAAEGKPVALVIDDDEAIRSCQRLLLGQAGFEVMTAPDGAQGIEKFKRSQEDIDLVITDFRMPSKDGSEVCKSIRSDKPDMPVILVSAEAPKVKADHPEQFSAVFPKPFEAKDLLSAAIRLTEQ